MIEMLHFYQNLYFTAILSEYYISHDLKNENNYKMKEVRTILSFLSFPEKTPFYHHISFKVNNIDYDSKFEKSYSQEYMDLNKKIVSLVS